MELREIIELLNAVAAREISEFELEREGLRLRIVKHGEPPAVRPVAMAPAAVAGPVAVERVTGASGTPEPSAVSAAADEEGTFLMRSPIVGTFYRAGSPTAEPYASVNDRVKKGQVICIVEAMKLMNEIESEVSGTVIEILVEDGQPVEYGEPLFKIRPER